jgi:predicted nucleic acid-binding protein
MTLSKSPADLLIADASVVINLNATGCAAAIIGALPNRLAVPGAACRELEDGARFGHDDARRLEELIAAGLVEKIEVGAAGAAVFESLIDGSALTTLDDGEAAAIACAVERAGVALLDERKARRLCGAMFPAVTIGSTAALLLHDAVAAALGARAHVEAFVMALQRGRMRVPPEHTDRVVALIGAERAATCPSLPRTLRLPAQ